MSAEADIADPDARMKLNRAPELAETWRDLPDPPRGPEPVDDNVLFESSA